MKAILPTSNKKRPTFFSEGSSDLRIVWRRPYLYAEQLESIFHAARVVVIEASTKAGKTVGCLVWLTEQAMKGGPGMNYWWVAPVFSQAKIAYRRLKMYLPAGSFTHNDSEMRIQLLHGPMIWFKSGDKPDTLFGEDVYAAVIDEASRVKEDSWTAVRSTLTFTRGPIRVIGNVKGKKNWAYRLARRAEQAYTMAPDKARCNLAYFKITAWDAVKAGVLRMAEIEEARELLTDEAFKELYLAEAGDDGGNPFGYEAIRRCMIPGLSSKPAVWFGVDLAKYKDWTVIIGLDEDGSMAEFHRFQAPWNLTFLRVLSVVGSRACLVDATGVGDPIVERLQQEGGSNFEGFTFTSSSKQKIMEGLAVAIQKNILGITEECVPELDNFEYEILKGGSVRYSAPPGLHDDIVCSLALANQCRLTKPMLTFV